MPVSINGRLSLDPGGIIDVDLAEERCGRNAALEDATPALGGGAGAAPQLRLKRKTELK